MLRWEELVGLPDAHLARCDVAEVNFACARGLPGANEADEEESLRLLDRCAWAVQKETGRIARQFDLNPGSL